jgi:hypothetical protein
MTIFIAVNFSLPVAAVFFTATSGWALLGLYFRSSSQRQYAEESNRSIGHRTYHDTRLRPPPIPRQETADFRIPRPPIEVSPPKPIEAARTLPAPIPEKREYKDIHLALADAIVEITQLIHSTNLKLSRFDGVMNKRLHKTTNSEHQSMIRARKILKALEARLQQLQAADTGLESGKVERETVVVLLDADLVVLHDPLTALPGEEPLPPIARDSWESTLQVLCKQIARKPSFLQILKHQQ